MEELLSGERCAKLLVKRKSNSNKGDYGHALLIAGSKGKMGAAVLATKACLVSGAGKVTVRVPACGENILQISVPEAMVESDDSETTISSLPELSSYNAIGIGPGFGVSIETQKMVFDLISRSTVPLVLDADALNCISLNKVWLEKLPKNTILTPHPKEFERLFGPTANIEERTKLQIEVAKKYKIIVVLKDAETRISDATGTVYKNTIGNSGMAKAGSGDVLTGIITGFLAQKYSPIESAILGVYLHSLAADIAVKETTEYCLLASVLIDNLPNAFKEIL